MRNPSDDPASESCGPWQESAFCVSVFHRLMPYIPREALTKHALIAQAIMDCLTRAAQRADRRVNVGMILSNTLVHALCSLECSTSAASSWSTWRWGLPLPYGVFYTAEKLRCWTYKPSNLELKCLLRDLSQQGHTSPVWLSTVSS